MAWPQLRPLIEAEIALSLPALAQTLFSRLSAAEIEARALAAQLYGLSPDAIAPRPELFLLDETVVLGVSVSDLFSTEGRQSFAAQLLRLLERTILGVGFTASDREAVLRRVIEVRQRNGLNVPVVRKGTVANGWLERFRAVLAAAIWGVVTPALNRATAVAFLQGAIPPRQWRWNAVLDPKTCPICRPLHKTVAASPEEFPRGSPPLHPHCRCIVVPITS